MAETKTRPDRYELRNGDHTFIIYKDREWAIHSADCYSSFFGVAVDVIDNVTGETIATKNPHVQQA